MGPMVCCVSRLLTRTLLATWLPCQRLKLRDAHPSSAHGPLPSLAQSHSAIDLHRKYAPSSSKHLLYPKDVNVVPVVSSVDVQGSWLACSAFNSGVKSPMSPLSWSSCSYLPILLHSPAPTIPPFPWPIPRQPCYGRHHRLGLKSAAEAKMSTPPPPLDF